MRWILPNGKQIWQSDSIYRINFDKPSRSKQQFEVKQFFKKYCYNHILYEEYSLPGTLLKVDFISATQKWAWEHQGVGHFCFNKFYHNDSRAKYLNSLKNDTKKYKILELNGYIIIESSPQDLPITKEWLKEKYNIIL